MKHLIGAPLISKIQHGVTLIELMVVVAIITIIAAIGYPSYTQYTIKSKRSAAQSYLFSVANKEEQYMLDARQYFSVPRTSTVCSNIVSASSVGISPPPEVTKNYNLDICATSATPPTYSITADPIGGQLTNDTKCGMVTLNQAGTKDQKTPATVADCW